MATALVQQHESKITDGNDDRICNNIPRIPQLIDDCWLIILKELPTEDLLSFCGVNEHFRDLCKNFILPNKLFDFNLISKKFYTNDVFKEYGKQMRRIRTSEFEFNHLLEWIINNCKANAIIELHMVNIKHTECTINNERLLHQALPYFASLEKLTFAGKELSKSFEKGFMKKLCSIPNLNLKVLILKLNNLDREWAQSHSLRNLEEIQLKYSVSDDVNFADFIRTKSQLKIFKYFNGIGFSSINTAALQCCNQLEVFSYFSHPPYSQVVFELPPVKHFSTILYDNGSDIHFWLGKNQNTLESLHIIVSEYNPYIAHPMTLATIRKSCTEWLENLNEDKFDKLTTVALWISRRRNPEHISELTYVLKFLSKLKNLKELKLVNWSATCNIYEILKHISHGIETITLENLEMQNLPHEMAQFALGLKELECKRKSQSKPIHLNVNQQQLEQLQTQAHITSAYTYSIKTPAKRDFFTFSAFIW